LSRTAERLVQVASPEVAPIDGCVCGGSADSGEKLSGYRRQCGVERSRGESERRGEGDGVKKWLGGGSIYRGTRWPRGSGQVHGGDGVWSDEGAREGARRLAGIMVSEASVLARQGVDGGVQATSMSPQYRGGDFGRGRRRQGIHEPVGLSRS
jgi:hypothetical protein